MKSKARFFAALLMALPVCADTLVRDRPQIKVPPKIQMKAWAFDLHRVRLLEGPFRQAMQRDLKYLLSIDADRLLSRFRQFSGLKPKAPEYEGWESDTISGHTLGHYLSAVAMMHASTGDARLLERLNYIVDELELCQRTKGTGFVGGFPHQDRLWQELRAGQIKAQPFNLNGIWVPWYTTHKLYQGLTDAYLLCGSRKALDIMVKLTDFVVELTNQLSDEQMQRMLSTEHGGVLESFTDVYALTGGEKYLKLARRWDHKRFMDPLARFEDNLTGLHGNTNIPKVIGAARQYEIAGEERYRNVARFFWEKVVRERSYAIGGHGDDEYFFPPERFREHVGSRTAETCNTYNMLKLTRRLFAWEPSAETADFYERALYNHILASQEHESGMMIYLCSLRPGHFKVFNTPFDAFWCCTGSGMENHAKYGDSIYFHDDAGLWVNLFIASELDWKEKGIKLAQQTRFPEEPVTRLLIGAAKPVKAAIRIRHPYWAEGALRISVNGSAWKNDSKRGSYAVVDRTWKKGDRVEVAFPMTLRPEMLPNTPDRVAVMYGPLVMAGLLGREGMPEKPLAKDRLAFDSIPAPEAPVVVSDDRDAAKWFKTVEGNSLRFAPARPGVLRALRDAKTDVELAPFYQIWNERYTVYWHLLSESAWKAQQGAVSEEQKRMKLLEARLTDAFRPAEIQPEKEHNFQGERAMQGDADLRRYREAARGGWFSFEMKVDPARPMELLCEYSGDFGGRTFDIAVDGVKVATQALEGDKPGQFYEITYAIPEEATRGKDKVTVKFQAAERGRGAGPLFKAWMLRR